jgi:hypothetical protein
MRTDFIYLLGRRFGRWLVLGLVLNKHGRHSWRCLCRCGVWRTVTGQSLRNGRSRSCGTCTPSWHTGLRSHGHAQHGRKTPEYSSWTLMRQRCLNPNASGAKHYKGNGVKICKRWCGPHGFQHFLEDLGPRPTAMTLGRYKDMGNYTPSNCKWMTDVEQRAEQAKKRALR